MTLLPGQLPPRIGLTGLDGLPDREDPELTEMMGIVSRLPQGGMEEMVRNLLRAALAFKRTADPEFAVTLVEGALATMRVRRDPEDEKALNAPRKPVPQKELISVDELVSRAGL
jgi:hypothetical protein